MAAEDGSPSGVRQRLSASVMDSETHKTSLLASLIEDAEAPLLSFQGAAANLSAGAVGAGLLALPSVMGAEGSPAAGVIGAIIMLVVAAAFQMVSNRCLSEAADLAASMLGKPCKSFDGVAEEAFGKFGTVLSSLMTNITTIGLTTAYIILLGTTVHDTLLKAESLKLSIGLVGVVLTPLTFVSLNDMLGTIAIVAEICILPFLIVAVVQHGPGDDWTMVGPAGQMGPAFCTVVFAIGFGFLVPTMKGQMEDPRQIVPASDIAVGVCFVAYIMVMCLGYWAWGNDVTGNVLDSMKGWLATVSRVLLFVNLIISYGIMMQVSVGSLADSLGERVQGRSRGIALRISLAVVSTLLALIVPFFNQFINLLSAFTMVGVNYLLPFTCYWTLRSRQAGSMKDAVAVAKGKFIIHLVVFAGGMLAMIFGIIGGVQNLIDAFNGDSAAELLSAVLEHVR